MVSADKVLLEFKSISLRAIFVDELLKYHRGNLEVKIICENCVTQGKKKNQKT